MFLVTVFELNTTYISSHFTDAIFCTKYNTDNSLKVIVLKFLETFLCGYSKEDYREIEFKRINDNLCKVKFKFHKKNMRRDSFREFNFKITEEVTDMDLFKYLLDDSSVIRNFVKENFNASN